VTPESRANFSYRPRQTLRDVTTALARGGDGGWHIVSPPHSGGEHNDAPDIESPRDRAYVVVPRSWGAQRGDLLLRDDDAVRLLYVCGPAHQASRWMAAWAAESTVRDPRGWIERHEVWVGSPTPEHPDVGMTFRTDL
jgi:hypothetical protein